MNDQIEIRVQGIVEHVAGVVSTLQSTYKVVAISPYRDVIPGNGMVRCTAIVRQQPTLSPVERLKAKRAALQPKGEPMLDKQSTILDPAEFLRESFRRDAAREAKNLGFRSLKQSSYYLARQICLYQWSKLPADKRQAWKDFAQELLLEAAGKS